MSYPELPLALLQPDTSKIIEKGISEKDWFNFCSANPSTSGCEEHTQWLRKLKQLMFDFTKMKKIIERLTMNPFSTFFVDSGYVWWTNSNGQCTLKLASELRDSTYNGLVETPINETINFTNSVAESIICVKAKNFIMLSNAVNYPDQRYRTVYDVNLYGKNDQMIENRDLPKMLVESSHVYSYNSFDNDEVGLLNFSSKMYDIMSHFIQYSVQTNRLEIERELTAHNNMLYEQFAYTVVAVEQNDCNLLRKFKDDRNKSFFKIKTGMLEFVYNFTNDDPNSVNIKVNEIEGAFDAVKDADESSLLTKLVSINCAYMFYNNQSIELKQVHAISSEVTLKTFKLFNIPIAIDRCIVVIENLVEIK